MKRFVICFFKQQPLRNYVMLGLFTLLLGSGASAGSSFCVQSFNTFGPAYAPKVRERSDLMVRHFVKHGTCEITQLQEVWRPKQQAQFESSVDEHMPHYTIEFPDKNYDDKSKTGLGLLTMGYVVSSQREVFEVNQDSWADWVRKKLHVKKAFSSYRLSFGENSPLNSMAFRNTHLHHSSQNIRLTQILQMSRVLLVEESFYQHQIVSGDFNFEPGSLEWYLVTLVLGFQDSSLEDSECTYCAANSLALSFQDRKIDYNFFRNSRSQHLQAEDSFVNLRHYEGRPLSDHYGVQTRFAVKTRFDHLNTFEINAFVRGGQLLPAIQVLEEVKGQLEDALREDFTPFIEYTEGLISRLQLASPSDPWVQHLLD